MTFWAMLIGTLAITGRGHPADRLDRVRGLRLQGCGDRKRLCRHTPSGLCLLALVIAALFTSFYSWRLMFLTFWGEPRGDKHTHEHAHESPTVMLVPLGVLALGAVFAGAMWYSSFFGHTNEVAKFFGVPYAEEHHAEAQGHGDAGPCRGGSRCAWRESHQRGQGPLRLRGEAGRRRDLHREGNTVLNDAHYVPTWVKVSPFVAMIIGFVTALWFYILNPACPRRWLRIPAPAVPVPAQQVVRGRDLRFPLREASCASWVASCGAAATGR
jgi:NADH-quinone oxidoreductase subunit L